MSVPFQRARQPEQMAARRSAILAATRDALRGKTVGDVTLGDISAHVGLAKSNVLRYFDSREAILLEVLHEEFRSWLIDLEQTLDGPHPRTSNYGAEIQLAETVSASLAGRELLCDLLGTMAGVLERNIAIDTARTFKLRTTERLAEFGALIETQLPWISAETAAFVAEATMGFVAGTYPFSKPAAPVQQAITELGLPEPGRRFAEGLRIGLTLWLIGARSQSRL